MTVITSVIFVELLFRWSVAVTVWSFATVPIDSVVETRTVESDVEIRIVESVSPTVDRLFTRPIPVASLARSSTVMFLAPSRKLELIVAEKSPFESVVITFEGDRYLLGAREEDTYA